jgi:hypothetical protein
MMMENNKTVIVGGWDGGEGSKFRRERGFGVGAGDWEMGWSWTLNEKHVG